MSLFQQAMNLAVNVGLTAVLFVILLRWLLNHFERRLSNIENRLTQFNESWNSKFSQMSTVWGNHIAKLNEDWNNRIYPERAIYVSTQQAKEIIEIALRRDTYDMLGYLASDMLWSAKTMKSDDDLRNTLQVRLWDILQGTRDFFSQFKTSQGLLVEPLLKALPLTTPDGIAAGDKLFQKMVEAVLLILRAADRTDQEKLLSLRGLAEKRLRDSTTLMYNWLDGREVPNEHADDTRKQIPTETAALFKYARVGD